MEYNEKQIQIIKFAEKLFANNGFTGTSIRDIAEAADINIAMISYYFGSKEKLLEAVFTFRLKDTTQTLESLLESKELSILDKLYKLIDYYVDKFQNQECFHKIMMRQQVDDKKDFTHELIMNHKKRNQQLLKQLIQLGQKSGEFSKSLDVSMLMTTFVGTISYAIATQHFYKEINNLTNMPDDQFQKLLKKKLSTHLKQIFKATLTYEV